uniref:Uncharacterized protein n=1 Tax=Anguilla anguilla TaxID=7936 RepID=A0A0E9VNY8_ANGAN
MIVVFLQCGACLGLLWPVILSSFVVSFVQSHLCGWKLLNVSGNVNCFCWLSVGNAVVFRRA